MNRKKLLFAGFGDIARRASTKLAAAGWDLTGIARGEREVPKEVSYWRGALNTPEIAGRLADEAFEVAVVTLTPDGRSDADYYRAYVENSARLIDVWHSHPSPPGLVIYVSSTRVYHQTDGSWVDENSAARPQRPAGQHLLKAEHLWRDSGLGHSVVRFAGIYGPGREQLLRQVVAGNGGPKADPPFTNRIHVEDCVGVIQHLIERYVAGEHLHSLYLAGDNEPVTSWELRSWLAQTMGYGPDHLRETPAVSRGGNKRCSNARLLATGYSFRYPDYRSGYKALLNQRRSV